MMIKINFSSLYFLKRPKNYQDGPIPIYMRITLAGKRAEFTTGLSCEAIEWNAHAGKINGTKERAKTINVYLDNLKTKVFDAAQSLSADGEIVTAEALKGYISGRSGRTRLIIETFQEHNRQIAALVGDEFAAGTLIRYQTSLRHTQKFIEWKYKVQDIDIKKINHEFITSYEFYLRSERKCANNSAFKYIKNFKKIVRLCLANGWLDRDPFINYKIKIKQVHRDYLSLSEIKLMAEKKLATERLSIVRDVFLFCCFTGLAYADIKKLRREEIVRGIQDEMWIHTKRQKTDTQSRIPLLPSALNIYHRYLDHPVCDRLGLVLPVLTNQKMNSYLKEIADVCGIHKELTFHIARHTFATTITLANGVPIESVSKMLGHTNIKTTQHYAKILDLKVGQDMAMISEKLTQGLL